MNARAVRFMAVESPLTRRCPVWRVAAPICDDAPTPPFGRMDPERGRQIQKE
jgi:hypothetical protein